MDITAIIAASASVGSLVCMGFMFMKMKKMESDFQKKQTSHEEEQKLLQSIGTELNGSLQTSFKNLGDMLGNAQRTSDTQVQNQLYALDRSLNDKLETVNKGVGEMSAVASSISDIKKVLSGVKTRGIMGEVQLGAIIQNILAPSQYDKEVSTIPNSKEHVEFAIKLPSPTNEVMYLPIDSKFPGDTFAALQTAYEHGDPIEIAECKKLLQSVIKKSAKDIRDKYIQSPYTTNFGIMFLPFEGLYAEVVSDGTLELLQNEYHVTVAGPSTMAAMLNSLQMCFSAFAIQKNSGEVLKTLAVVKSEFETFADVLAKTQKHVAAVEKDLDTLMGVRTKKINKALSAVQGTADTSEKGDFSYDNDV